MGWFFQFDTVFFVCTIKTLLQNATLYALNNMEIYIMPKGKGYKMTKGPKKKKATKKKTTKKTTAGMRSKRRQRNMG